MSDEELQALILTRLSALALPGRRASPPSRTVRTRWSQDPYARGVYSYWRPGNQPGMYIHTVYACMYMCTSVISCVCNSLYNYNTHIMYVIVIVGIRAELARREGSVFFAGEAVHESSLLSASVHGAWLSGVGAGAAACDYLDIPVVLPKELQML